MSPCPGDVATTMSVLSAFLARDQVVSPQKIDEAIQRQVINGGDFETNLLEVGAIAEDTLAAYCAAVFESVPLGRDEIAAAGLSSLSRLSRATAESLRIVPVAVDEGRLVLAAAEPLDDDARARVEREVGMPVDTRIATPFRVTWALSKFYSVELSPRLQRLAARLDSKPSGQMRAVTRTPSVPPTSTPSRPPGAMQHNLRASVLAALSAALADEREGQAPAEHGPEGPPVRPSLTTSLVAALTAPNTGEEGRFSVPPAPAPPGAKPAVVEPADATTASLADNVISRAAESAALAAVAQSRDATPPAVPEAPAIPEAPAAPAISFDDAQRLIQRAKDRDAILAALLDYAAGTVSYAAAFVVHGDAAEGLDARGAGLDGDGVRGIAVPLDAPGSFQTVRARGEPVLGALGTTGTDAVIKRDLGREAVRNVALLPIHIAGRVALILWADQGAGALDLAGMDRLGTLCLDAARAFEKIIRERKKRRVASETAAHAAAAIATGPMPTITPAEIQRRFAEQRGTQALHKLAAQTSPPSAANTSTTAEERADEEPSDERATPTMPSNPPPSRSQAPSPRADATLEASRALAGDRSESTRHARGGRVPVAVDVIGPLPAASLTAEAWRTARTNDPRREPDEVDLAAASNDEPSRLLAEVVRTGQLSDHIANELLGAGERALQAAIRYFPGPTHIERGNTRAKLPPIQEIGPLIRLVVMFRQASGPYLVEQLESYDAERRYYATLCLGDVVFPPALEPLVARLYDTDYPTAVAAIDAIRAYRRLPAYEDVLASLCILVADLSAPADRRRTAANALGELRDVEAIGPLIVALQDRDGALAGIARRSLVTLTRQDFSQDSAAWENWWREAKSRHRIEWLIEALLHTDPTLRHDASEELKKITGQFFGYYFNLPRRERERAHGRYLEWWQYEGRSRFR